MKNFRKNKECLSFSLILSRERIASSKEGPNLGTNKKLFFQNFFIFKTTTFVKGKKQSNC